MLTAPPAARAILLDIEGTTTPIAFVHETLFPFARRRLRAFLHGRAPEAGVEPLETLAAALRAEHTADLSTGEPPPRWDDTSFETRIDSMAAYCEWLMDRDRKSTPLKELQGRIWAEGYAGGEIVGDVFDDVPHAFARWRSAGIRIAIFSSGSIQAQQLLFKYSSAGDLAGYIDAYFDTTTGAKREAESYERIAEMLGSMPADMLFISDVIAELDAARGAGMQTRLAVRPGNAAAAGTHGHRVIDTFDDV